MQQVGFELKNKNNNIETFLKETDESMRECGRIRWWFNQSREKSEIDWHRTKSLV